MGKKEDGAKAALDRQVAESMARQFVGPNPPQGRVEQVAEDVLAIVQTAHGTRIRSGEAVNEKKPGV